MIKYIYFRIKNELVNDVNKVANYRNPKFLFFE